ncbi:unnamed protein product [Lactuca virosa]|uniref:VHS domain-containing protein n=1 Tax=Lactuca virosa TaxID=75947 RepID=A0AAU9N1H8_9ASTR|nr:unnamed protein product [Lactuca virosa]
MLNKPSPLCLVPLPPLSLLILQGKTSPPPEVSSHRPHLLSSEKVLDDMVMMVEDVLTDEQNRTKVVRLIGAWGESEDLTYLPVFCQTHLEECDDLSKRPTVPVELGILNLLEKCLQVFPRQLLKDRILPHPSNSIIRIIININHTFFCFLY